MLNTELLDELHKLSPAEKLRVVQILVNELATEETSLMPDMEYPIYTPFGNDAAADILLQALKASEAADQE